MESTYKGEGGGEGEGEGGGEGGGGGGGEGGGEGEGGGKVTYIGLGQVPYKSRRGEGK